MASTAKKSRRETVEAMRRQERRAERRKTLLLVGGAGAVSLGLVAAAAYQPIVQALNDPADQAIASFGVPAAQAACTDVEASSAQGQGEHVPQGTTVEYDAAPPAFGAHWDLPASFNRKFYERGDRPPLEQLVHNQEHGYTLVWYDESVADEQVEELRGLSARLAEEEATGGKIIVAPWTADDGEAFPGGASIAVTHWSRQEGQRMYCDGVSGEAIGDFVQEFPYTDSPEPFAA